MNFTHQTQNTTFTISFLEYKNINKALRAMIILILNIASSILILPTELNITFINSTSQPYTGTKKGGDCIFSTKSIRVFKASLPHMRMILAHELGHMEHYVLHSDSTTWNWARKEDYAGTASALVVGMAEKGVIVNHKNSFSDIRGLEGKILRSRAA